ncbi:kynurenine 3-monooxygenase, mitochondrial precursor [Savitreella phatthalungensis]
MMYCGEELHHRHTHQPEVGPDNTSWNSDLPLAILPELNDIEHTSAPTVDLLINHSSSLTSVDMAAVAEPQGKVVVVGAGLVGCLTAISFARRGFTVELYEARSDIRGKKLNKGRSINLAVSARGLGAIGSVDAGLRSRIETNTIPMKGRMIHVGGKQESQLYGLFGEAIRSIDRAQLNLDLLNEALKYAKVSANFEHRLVSANLNAGKLRFQADDGAFTETSADLVVGCDGVNSTVRNIAMKAQHMNFAQDYIDHAYLELSIPPTDDGDFSLSPEHLHIWPRQEFMLIALPNPDKSFTSTLFAPQQLFDSIKSTEDITTFFEREFPDALEKIGRENLAASYTNNPISALVQVRCSPHHYRDKVILLGDATHAMVPFYGQGMNCGFEDVRKLNELLDKHTVTPTDLHDLGVALEEYSKTRHEDVLAILKLAMNNYVEMRSSVTSRLYRLRKFADSLLGRLIPGTWVPMYTMVSFRDDIRYSEVVKREEWQAATIQRLVKVVSFMTIFGATYGALRVPRVRLRLKLALLRLTRLLERQS